MTDLVNYNFAKDLTKLIEAGINKHLNSSFLYSPLKVAYNIFKKSNPNIINQTREYIAQDIEKMLTSIDNYKENIFVNQSRLTRKGEMARKIAYNIGINLLKKELNVRTAFKATRNREVREQIYRYIFTNLHQAIEFLITQDEINLI